MLTTAGLVVVSLQTDQASADPQNIGSLEQDAQAAAVALECVSDVLACETAVLTMKMPYLHSFTTVRNTRQIIQDTAPNTFFDAFLFFNFLIKKASR